MTAFADAMRALDALAHDLGEPRWLRDVAWTYREQLADVHRLSAPKQQKCRTCGGRGSREYRDPFNGYREFAPCPDCDRCGPGQPQKESDDE
jgi:hypothetical protein